MKRFSFLAVTVLLLVACSRHEKITRYRDYAGYLDSTHLQKALRQQWQEAAFWRKRLEKDSGSYVNKLETARYLLNLFRLTGQPVLLEEADALLESAAGNLGYKDPDLLFALSQNNITRHRFQKAASFNDAAEKANADRYTLCLLRFDAAMELGKYDEAHRALGKLKDRSAFDYLIRKAKWEDHKGNLPGAIQLMERALEKVKQKPSLRNWALSNLSDMYAHAGQIKTAYQGYLEVLEKDPTHFHSLEGIARIAFSHDRDLAAARDILSFLTRHRYAPDIVLLQAEIAGESGDRLAEKKYTDRFRQMLQGQPGADMYNHYLIEVLSEEESLQDSAVKLAAMECRNRFTPEICDLMAWSLYKKGDTAAAYRYAKAYVYNRTAEPAALFHTAIIFAAAKDYTVARVLLQDCQSSAFELGPSRTREVNALLKALPRH